MENENVFAGEDLSKYLSDKREVDENKLAKLTTLIDKLGSHEYWAFDMEKEPLMQMCKLKAESMYRKIDLSFLEISTSHKFFNQDFLVLKFFVSTLHYTDNLKIETYCLSKRTGYVKLFHRNEKDKLPEIFYEKLVKAFEFNKYSKPERNLFAKNFAVKFKIPCELRKNINKNRGKLYLSLPLLGIIPEKNKEKIKASEKIISKKNHYIITTADYDAAKYDFENSVNECLLIEGIANQYYLIDVFTTI